jgi:hypothetical protein
MITKLMGVATLFAAGSILVAGTPTLGAQAVEHQASAATDLTCGQGLRCGGGGGGRRCATAPRCATKVCGTKP